MKFVILSILLVLSPLSLLSQIIQGGGASGTFNQTGAGQPNTNTNNVFQDTTKKIRKPGDKFLDDTTRQIYGAYSTRYRYLIDYIQVTGNRYIVDTTLDNFHRYNFVQANSNKAQDLGTIGTAIKPLFPSTPASIGSRLGIETFSYYIIDFEKVKFFNTRSPYSSWTYAQGGSGRSVLDVNFAINSGPDLNVFAGYRSLGSKLLTGNLVQSNRDRQARHRTFYIGGIWERRYYKLMAMAMSYSHSLIETGGLSIDSSILSLSDLYNEPPQRLTNQLTNVRGEQKGFQFNLYQEYGIDSTRLQLFMYSSITSQSNSYEDKTIGTKNQPGVNYNFYAKIYFPYDARTYQETNFLAGDTRVGVKSRRGGVFFSFYARNKFYRYRQKSQVNFENGLFVPAENFLGTNISLTLKKIGKINFEAEHLLNKDYRLSALSDFNWFSVGYKSSLIRPTLVQTHFVGNHAWWFNRFRPTFFNEIFGAIKLESPKIRFEPLLRFFNANDLIYFNEHAEPAQLSSSEQFAQLSVNSRLKTGPFTHSIELIYTRLGDNSVIRLPAYFVNYQIYYFRNVLKGSMLIQIGFDNHWRSSFKADAYDPFTQQFYLQNRYEIGNYWQCDFFANALINRTRFFVKLTNILKGLISEGDFSTPGYMMQQRQFEFGVSWMSFD